MAALQGAAQGASMGAAFGPWGAAIGGLAGGLLGASDSGGGMPSSPAMMGGAEARPMAGQAAAFGSGLDGSGWNVVIGNGSSATVDNRQDKAIDATGPTAVAVPTSNKGAGGYDPYMLSDGYVSGLFGAGSTSLATVPGWVWLLFGGAVLWRLSKSKK
jgi:hypothetical protein